jgi:uncharacterized protein
MIRALVLCDDPWHPAATIRAGLRALEDSYAFDWLERSEDWSAERMDRYPIVVLAKSNTISPTDHTPWVTPEVEAAFQQYVERGNGLLAIHSGTAGYTESSTLRPLLGGVFVRHPAQCAVTVTPRAGHAMVAGVDAFTAHDEHYMMALDDAAADVFLTTSSEHGEQPGGWTRSVGAGRVCVLTPGHNLPVWTTPAYERMIRNALAWVSKSDE